MNLAEIILAVFLSGGIVFFFFLHKCNNQYKHFKANLKEGCPVDWYDGEVRRKGGRLVFLDAIWCQVKDESGVIHFVLRSDLYPCIHINYKKP